MKRICLIALCLLCGCSLPAAVWEKEGVTHAQFNIDNRNCEGKAAQVNYGAGPSSGLEHKAYYEECMEALGYVKEGRKEKTDRNEPDGVLDTSH
jgi:hypothetical protein